MKKILNIILCAGLMATFVAGCGSKENGKTAPSAGEAAESAQTYADTVYKFDVSFSNPEPASVALTETFDRIQEASGGRIEFTYYYSWSLSSVATIIDDFNAGIVDIGVVPINQHTNLFPYSNLVTSTPFLGLPSMEATSRIYDELYNEYDVFQEEYENAGLHYWTNFSFSPFNLFTVSKEPVDTPDKLNGVKIITDESSLQQFVTDHGGAPVSSPVTEYATNLNTNVVDGAINQAPVFSAFGCLDFLNSATIFGDQGMSTSIGCMCFSREAWDSLPEDLQKLFNDEAADMRDNYTAEVKGMADNAIETLKSNGGNVTYLTDGQISEWSSEFEDILDKKIDSLVSEGYVDAQKYYDIVKEKIAGYKQ